jgi:hypothetical protein
MFDLVETFPKFGTPIPITGKDVSHIVVLCLDNLRLNRTFVMIKARDPFHHQCAFIFLEFRTPGPLNFFGRHTAGQLTKWYF